MYVGSMWSQAAILLILYRAVHRNFAGEGGVCTYVYVFVCRCIRGLLKDKLVILVTHQVHFALQGDKLLALKDVSILQYLC